MTEPVSNWATDYDVLDPDYVANPFPVWDELRTSCPVAHTDRWGGSWMPTTYADVTAMAHDIEHFSSRRVGVIPPQIDPSTGAAQPDLLPGGLPPISADPPLHTWTRRLLLPWFSPARVGVYETSTRELCQRLIDGFAADGRVDAAADYAQQIPVRIIGMVLGVPDDMSDTFTGWVRDILEFAHDNDRRIPAVQALVAYFNSEIEQRRHGSGDDLITTLLHTEVDGHPVADMHVLGTAALTLIAGVDTTWSAIGSALWHLATQPDDQRRLRTEPGLMPTAIEELLRAYSPVTMARIVTTDVDYNGCPMHEGDRVLMNFPAANRDPAQFPDADTVILDREANRHVAFGSGIHRCAGSNLARMELRVAIQEFLARIPDFSLDPVGTVTWAGGQVRGPRQLPVVF
ncbi:MAG: cytochrome P450 [Ilumatobacteraceae bacterium]